MKHQFEFAGYYAAKEMGFYEEAGLDVDIRECRQGMDVSEEVLSNRVQFAAVSSSVIKNYLNGKPVKLVANIFKHSALVLLSHRNAGIRTPDDLYGKRLMLTSQERNAVEFLSFFAKNGINPKKLSYVDHNFDPMAVVNGQADVMSAYITNQPFILQQKCIPYNILDPAAYGVDFYGDSLITSAKLSEQSPELVEAFKETSLRGWKYALQHSEEIIDLILSKYNTTNKSREALRYEATETEKLILPETYPLGSIDPERVRHIANAMYKAGIVKNKPNIESLIFGLNIKSQLPLAQSKKSKKPLISLTADERAWLKSHTIIRVHNEKDWPPFNYFKYGSPWGLSIDYMNMLAERLGIKIKYVTGPNWNEFLGMIQRKELDVMLNIVKTEDRQKYILYTKPYVVNPNVIVSAKKERYKKTEELLGKTVAVAKGAFYEEILNRHYPQVKLLLVKDALESFKAVSFGKADAAVSEQAVANHLISEHMLTDLVISGELDMGNPDLANLHIGIRDDWPLLQSAIMKAMADITIQEMKQLRQKWLIESKNEASQLANKWISSKRLIVYTVILFVVLSLFTLILIKTIKEKDIAVSFGSLQFRLFVLAGLSIIIIIICLLSWFTLEQNKKKVLVGIGENLKIILNTANDKLKVLVTQKESFTKLFEHNPKLLAISSKDFSQVLHTHSGETYAINSEGLLLSESCFNNHLQQIGLIEKGQQSALNIEIRNPGVNMVEGRHPTLERPKQPLTYMASRVIQLKSDMEKTGQRQGYSKIEFNTKAYRDYRGVFVFGAWLWSADLRFGLATEIDADEALSAYHMMRMTVFGITGFTLLLLVGAILFILILGERASRALIKARDNLEEKVEERTAELRENQERLALAEERSRLLLDSAGEGIFGVDTKGQINFVNLSAVSMLGYPENELIGQEVHQLIHHSHSNSSSYPLGNSPIFKVYTDGTSHHEEDEALRRKDETCFHVEYTATPMKKDGKLAGAVFTFNDITKRKQAQEKLSQSMKDLERFSKLAVGREERMINLKEEINELLRKSGQPNKYKIVA